MHKYIWILPTYHTSIAYATYMYTHGNSISIMHVCLSGTFVSYI